MHLVVEIYIFTLIPSLFPYVSLICTTTVIVSFETFLSIKNDVEKFPFIVGPKKNVSTSSRTMDNLVSSFYITLKA
jgi:hypothetical protein